MIEYYDNYSDTSGSLWHFKRDKNPANNADLSIVSSKSFKYKVAFVWKTVDVVHNTNSSVKNTKIAVPLKYLELKWIESFILSSAGDSSKFEIMDAKLHVPAVTLSTKLMMDLKDLLIGTAIRLFCKSIKSRN